MNKMSDVTNVIHEFREMANSLQWTLCPCVYIQKSWKIREKNFFVYQITNQTQGLNPIYQNWKKKQVMKNSITNEKLQGIVYIIIIICVAMIL